jgi:hypothetical protein
MSGRRRAALALALAAGVGACATTAATPPVPPPLRPKPRPGAVAARQSEKQDRTDCERSRRRTGLPPLSYDERSIEEAENLANQGQTLLRTAGDGRAPEQQRMLEKAVARLITALLADPYNVHATYNLAAAYARIGRVQCAVNLLGRLVPLRKLPSQKAVVEAKLDRLFGRAQYKGRLDPDFLLLRDDPRFRDLAKDF